MATRVIKSISPLGIANISAAILGGIGGLFFVIFWIASIAETYFTSRPGMFEEFFKNPILVIAIPFGYVAMGWIQGWLAAVLFNLAARLTGGVRVEVDEVSTDA